MSTKANMDRLRHCVKHLCWYYLAVICIFIIKMLLHQLDFPTTDGETKLTLAIILGMSLSGQNSASCLRKTQAKGMRDEVEVLCIISSCCRLQLHESSRSIFTPWTIWGTSVRNPALHSNSRHAVYTQTQHHQVRITEQSNAWINTQNRKTHNDAVMWWLHFNQSMSQSASLCLSQKFYLLKNGSYFLSHYKYI